MTPAERNKALIERDKAQATVQVKCIGCEATGVVVAKQPKDFVPICHVCGMPMVAVSAKVRGKP
jgi:hypothetical protein